MGRKMLQELYFPFSPLRVPLNKSILYMHISTNTTDIGIHQLILVIACGSYLKVSVPGTDHVYNQNLNTSGPLCCQVPN